ncbi:hypothetical protein [Legionella pneumophila]
MNANDCFVEKEYEEKTRETVPLFDERDCYKTKDLENEIDLDDEFYAIRSMN